MEPGEQISTYFNRDAFTQPAPGTLGHATRNLAVGPALWQIDLAMVPISVVYSDYNDVPGLGVKIPYTGEMTWTNGRGTYTITSLQPNVAIDAARFGRPTPPSQAAN